MSTPREKSKMGQEFVPTLVEYKCGGDTPWVDKMQWLPLMYSLVAGLSTSIGALIVFFVGKFPGNAVMASSLGLAAGVMLSVTIFDMWVPAIFENSATFGEITNMLFWSILGAAAFKFLSWLVPSDGLTEPETDTDDNMEAGVDATPSSAKLKALERRNIRLAAVMMTTLTAHNLPEGVAVAFSTLENQKLGIMVTFAIAVHNIPEGLAIAIPVYASTSSRCKAILATTLSGLSEPIGALIGLVVLKPVMSQTVLHNILFFVAGMMAAVSVFELIPEGSKYNEPRAQVAGIAAGFICMFWTYTYDV